MGRRRGLGVESAALNDDQVRRLLAAAEVQATQSLEANHQLLGSLAERLEEIETLEGDELDDFLAQAVPITVARPNGAASAHRTAPMG